MISDRCFLAGSRAVTRPIYKRERAPIWWGGQSSAIFPPSAPWQIPDRPRPRKLKIVLTPLLRFR